MRVSYQHANVRDGNESSLLRFTAADGTRACVLVDSGAGVDLDALLAPDEYLNAILLTHAHIDHYRTLARSVRHSAPIYTSPATAAVLEHALPEARKDNDLGDLSPVFDHLEAIDDWTSILADLEVRPVPAGHTPGAAGFVVRFRDENGANGPFSDEHHLLVTGDFTRRPCAGFPGLATAYPFDIDTLFLTVSSDDTYPDALETALRTILERAYAGSRVVVATSSLTGVHVATLLDRLAATLDRHLPITLVGQTATVYAALEATDSGAVDETDSAVETVSVFDRPDAVLEHGGVTVAGPADPTRGSASRLFGAVADDPAAVFVRLGTGNGESLPSVRCTTHCIDLRNHPSLETIDDLVHELAPTHVVVKHATGGALNWFQRRFDHCFTWGTNDEDVHRLYDEGEWLSPGWIAEQTATQIRTQRWELAQSRSTDVTASLPSVRRGSVDLEAEGVDLESFERDFAVGSDAPAPSAASEGTPASATRRSDGSDERVRPGPTESSHGSTANPETAAGIGTELKSERETIPARVLTDGDSEQILRLLERADVDAGDVVEITIDASTAEPE
ncbi:MBL fold metallo-hydrolase [Natronolimnohabitans innermongolicus]|uniref:Beta-lactamase n=1 Tax=Natronolimnohabitans innermongolicus JCM 12255 TaxID=1227499 RepID=L9WUZ4_9EURY|nr:MBL fold metallo-hydrolase [Natronolimnohabitans innermongolicus]ELY53314.1 beta-lactamase [Natronolimnohabitans innermongolicus JCM 12255]